MSEGNGQARSAGSRVEWQRKRLEDICNVLDNRRKPITKRDRVAGPIPYYGATGVLDYVEGFLFDEELVLVGEDGAKWHSGENTAFAVAGKCWVNNHAHVLRPNRHEVFDNWLIYFLNHSDLSGYVTGLTVPKLNQGNLRSISVPIPPLPEQRRIVAILDEAFAAIAAARANAERNLRNARAVFESHLEAFFSRRGDGWLEERLEAIADPSCSLSYGIVQPGKEWSDGLPVVRPTDMTTKLIGLDGLKRVKPEVASAYKRTTLVGDELLLCVRGSTGVVAVASEELRGANVTRGIVPIRFASSVMDQGFGYYLFRSSQTQNQIRAATYGAALMQINIRELRQLRLTFPSLREQARAVGMFNSLYKETQALETLYQRKLAALDELKKSLLDRAFSGRL